MQESLRTAVTGAENIGMNAKLHVKADSYVTPAHDGASEAIACAVGACYTATQLLEVAATAASSAKQSRAAP